MEGRGGFHSNFPLLSFLLLALAPCSCLFKSPVGKAHILPAFCRDFLHHYRNEQHRQCQRRLAEGWLLKSWVAASVRTATAKRTWDGSRCWQQEGEWLPPVPTVGTHAIPQCVCRGVPRHPKLPCARSWGCRPRQKRFPE